MIKILLVEDNEINRDMLSRRLERKGYEVMIAVNGQEGVAKALSDQPDLVLMDLHLPVLDGWEAARQIKANVQTQAIPVIALTADAIAGEREKALAAGCDDYDTKPVDLPRLLEKITGLLARSAPKSALPLPPEPLNFPSNHRLQRMLRTRLRRELDPPIYCIVGYSDMLLDTLSESQPALRSDLQKIHTSGVQLLQLIHAILNPILVELQQQDVNLLAPALRLELLTPLSTIIGYCEMLLEEAPADLVPDLEQIQTSARNLLSRINSLDSLVKHHLESLPATLYDSSLTEPLVRSTQISRRFRALESFQSADQSCILVIDPDGSSSLLLCRQLERQGFQVVVATSAQQGLETIARLSCDLILIDLHLAEMNGWAMLEQLKQRETDQPIPLLLITDADQIESVIGGIAVGATDYLTRPFQSVLLHAKVAACLEIGQRHRTEAALQQQIAALQQELEQSRQAQQVAEIVQTDYFQQLQSNPDPQDTAVPAVLPPKVLLVEDNDLNCDMLSRRLQRHGYTVVIASDGAEGVSKAVSEQPQIVLMDISLPVMDGWEATQQLKDNPQTRHIPVIALTAHAMTGDREKALAAGCDDYDTKPIDLPRLLSKIESCLKHSAKD